MQRQHAHGIARLAARRHRPGARFCRILDRQHAVEAVHLHQRQAVRAQHALQGRQHRLARHRAAGLRGDHRLDLAVDDIVKMQLITEDLAHDLANIGIDEVETHIAVGRDVDARGAWRRRRDEYARARRDERARSACLFRGGGGVERRRRLRCGLRQRSTHRQGRPWCRGAGERRARRRARGQQQHEPECQDAASRRKQRRS